MAKLGGLVAILLVGALAAVGASPTPSVGPALAKLEDAVRPVSVALAPSVGNLLQVQVAGAGKQRPNNAEKLKRGLTNFMNQLNPAAYFVPSPAGPDAKLAGAKGSVASLTPGTSAESAAIVNPDPMAGDVLIKGPRLSQTRPIGGPLRWGRR